ncbi:MAG TPA: tetratricopeptide repeat protein [Pirellulales bacterium]|nr:tetratricopeptide repeat protein [Pirellulales bacterium]
MNSCPSGATLELLIFEALPIAERSSIEAHVEICPSCQIRLEESTNSSAGINLPQLRSAAIGSSFAESTRSNDRFEQMAQDALSGWSEEANSAGSGAQKKELPSIAGFEILGELGSGAAAKVYKAHQLCLNRLVALKVILPDLLSCDDRQRFQIEALAIARLRHPNIVEVYDAGEQSGFRYLCLEFVEGQNLAQWTRGMPQAPQESAAIVECLAKAVYFAHQNGVVHRDLKPSNILIGNKSRTENTQPAHLGREIEAFDYEIKIADFGLAKMLPGTNCASALTTQPGAILGTPSYVAPEQVRRSGSSDAPGTAADIYSLGAILYELLAGRPPFQGATAIDTLLQVVHHEAVPIARLVPKVPRDLETICAKCLEKNPQLRYSSAEALAADLTRFRRHQPIAARPIGPMHRLLRWGRRKPVHAGIFIAGLLVMVAIAAACVRSEWRQAERVHQLDEDLRIVTHLQQQADWSQANLRLERVRDRLGSDGPIELRRWFDQLDAARRAHALSARIAQIRLNRADVILGPFNNARAAKEYEAAFKETGLDVFHSDPDLLAANIKASPACTALLAALDDWAACLVDRKRQICLMTVARRVDPDPWRDLVRDPTTWSDREAQLALIRSVPDGENSVPLLVALGERVYSGGGDATHFLKQIQEQFPADFWANYELGMMLNKKKSPDAARFFQAALAIRPGTPAVYNNLGNALRWQGRMDEAIQTYRQAIQMDPNDAWAYVDLGSLLLAENRCDDAIEQFECALKIDPDYDWGHYVLGNAYQRKYQLNDAIAHYNEAIRLNPELSQAYDDKGRALFSAGRLDDAITQFRQSICVNPGYIKPHYNLGDAYFCKRSISQAIDEYSQALFLKPALTRIYDALGEAYCFDGDFENACDISRRGLSIPSNDDAAFDRMRIRLDRSQSFLALESRVSAVAEGVYQPRDRSETMLYAELCYLKHQYVAAARLYAKALADHPQIVDEPGMRNRYLAACAAAQAGSKPGEDSEKLGAEDRLQWRNQAREWLHDSLVYWEFAMNSDTAATQLLAHRYLVRCLADPQLAVLRDSSELAKLTAEEQHACHEIWNSLNALLEQRQGIRMPLADASALK